MAEGSSEKRRLEWQDASIMSIAPLSRRISAFIFAPSRPFAFRAGQHLDMRLTAPDGHQAERSYSIASSPETPERIELAIERIEDGKISPFFHEIAEIGDAIEIRGPRGHFAWGPKDGGPVLLIGGGSGVVPLVSMLRHRAAQAARVPALLLYSARTWDDVIYRDELISLDGRRDGFDLICAITREPPQRGQDFGRRIDREMLDAVLAKLPAPPLHAFICGTNGFVRNATGSAIAAGVPAEIIRTERYGD
jgi:ferredoxin-NADP reductase